MGLFPVQTLFNDIVQVTGEWGETEINKKKKLLIRSNSVILRYLTSYIGNRHNSPYVFIKH